MNIYVVFGQYMMWNAKVQKNVVAYASNEVIAADQDKAELLWAKMLGVAADHISMRKVLHVFGPYSKEKKQ